jgi:D-tyrosyl-tRNA(Tyr) deacylase
LRAVIQRVKEASVRVDGCVVGAIARGLTVLLGVGQGDAEADAASLAERTVNLRLFPDAQGQMNLSALDVKAELLAVSQFTLYGDARKGRRPSYIDAARPEEAQRLYAHYVTCLRGSGLKVEEGVFRAMMDVALVNDGPVTILLDSRKQF